MGKGKDWNRRKGSKEKRKSHVGALSGLAERREPLFPPWDHSRLLPVPGPGGFGQLTQPPGETHTDRHTQKHTTTESHRWRDRQRETKDRKRLTKRDMERMKVSVVTGKGLDSQLQWMGKET